MLNRFIVVVIAFVGEIGVEALAQFLAGLEERHPLFLDEDGIAGTRVATGAGWAIFHRKRAETAQFDPISSRQRICDRANTCCYTSTIATNHCGSDNSKRTRCA